MADDRENGGWLQDIARHAIDPEPIRNSYQRNIERIDVLLRRRPLKFGELSGIAERSRILVGYASVLEPDASAIGRWSHLHAQAGSRR